MQSRVTESRSLVGRLGAEWRPLALGCLCLVGTNVLGLAIPWLLKGSVDAIRSLGDVAGAPASRVVYDQVVRNALLIIVAAVGQAGIRTASRIFIFNAGRNVEYGLRRDLFAHLLGMDAGFFRRHATGDLMSRLTSDLSSVRMLFGPGILNVANTLFTYGAGGWLLYHLSPRLTLFALLPYPFLILAARLSSRRIYAASRDLQQQLGALAATVHEDVAGIAVVKGYALEEHRHDGFAAKSRHYLEGTLRLARARGVLTPLFAMIGAVGTLIVLWAGGHEVIAGRLTLGGLIAFNAYLLYLSGPTISFGWILAVWQRGLAAWARVSEMLAARSTILDPGAGDVSTTPPRGGTTLDPLRSEPAPLNLQPTIALRDLAVGDALSGLSLDIPAGSNVAIVGPTGSGKTTLVDAILRLTEVPAGSYLLGGRPVHELPLRSARRMIGYAPQEAFLFSASIADNVGFGLPPDLAPDERENRIAEALEAAGMGRDLAVLPAGASTVVGERGIMLSGGQRQRVALARALATRPPILVLDDALSAVDAETEHAIIARLAPLLHGRTAIVISHRVAAIREADQIFVLDQGRLVERGTHDELVQRGGVYAGLYREQWATS